MSEQKLLYLGDTSLREAACYLAGVMSHFGIHFDYLASDVPFSSAMLKHDYSAFVISDYPARNFSTDQLDLIVGRVRAGAGLLMIGGWESFTGFGGDYQKTVLCDALPVLMQNEDDRVNCAQPCLVEIACDHVILKGLPFDDAAPGIGGFNRIKAKPGAVEVLSSRRYRVRRKDRNFQFEAAPSPDPLLVTGTLGEGRTAAFASDAAPHWVGGLVR